MRASLTPLQRSRVTLYEGTISRTSLSMAPFNPSSDWRTNDESWLLASTSAIEADVVAVLSDVTTLSVPASRPPDASKDGEMCGDGGCTAMALTKIKVWSSKSMAVTALDAQIPRLHAKWSDKDERARRACAV